MMNEQAGLMSGLGSGGLWVWILIGLAAGIAAAFAAGRLANLKS
jgi:hypothetical protein